MTAEAIEQDNNEERGKFESDDLEAYNVNYSKTSIDSPIKSYNEIDLRK